MSTHVRLATMADVEAMCGIGRAAWPSTYAFAGHEYVEHGLATWWSSAAVEQGLVTTTTLVAESDSRVVGVGNVDLRPDVPVIWKLYVDPDHQGRGFGGRLLEGLIGAVPVERGAVAIEYIEGNGRAASLYASRGFVEVRRVPSERPDWPRQIWAQLLLSG